MVITSSKAVKKMIYDQKLRKYFTDYTQILVVGADNLGANQLRNIRQGLKTDCDAVLLMGKDSMMKNAITTHAPATGKAAFLGLVPHLAGRVGLVFTKGDINYLNEVSEIVANKYKLQPLLCSSSDIGMYNLWQWLLSDHLDLLNRSGNN